MTVFNDLIQKQKVFFRTGKTKEIQYRIDTLKRLKTLIQSNENKIYKALKDDLGKCEFESYATEIGLTLNEISEAIKNIHKWAKPRKVKRRIVNFPDKNFVYPQPYGVCLVIGPWNYPLQLTLAPVIAAILAGNCVIIKPSELAPSTSNILSQIISGGFPSEYLAIVEGGIKESQALLQESFDFIFFTGGSKIGRIVMEAAAKNLTPVVLELGGKSPAIVDLDANLEIAAKRIIWGKFLNAGQTCVAPDYLLVNSKISDKVIDAMIRTIRQFYGDDPYLSPDYSRIINEKHFDRLMGLMSGVKILTGGKTDRNNKYIAPTIITEVDWDDPIMQEEIFGPILPVLEYDDLNDVLDKIASRPKPLALYYFSSDNKKQKKVIDAVEFGGGCINDSIMHLLNQDLPFGGIGESGMGSYHGRAGFVTFSHHKSILKKSTWIDMALRYPPYSGKLKWMKKILK